VKGVDRGQGLTVDVFGMVLATGFIQHNVDDFSQGTRYGYNHDVFVLRRAP